MQRLRKNLKIHRIYMEATAVVPRVPRLGLVKLWWQQMTVTGEKKKKKKKKNPKHFLHKLHSFH